mmetsp:Transcript_4128/g.5498  ORF Transcript_4128/g.5498 Transcript_4128/m.5498 type:complete len:169 (-) Transcript_4128:309-815(-)|eukprot:CAMPEP_0204860908 /NCGR_PEP_ID=MMETSP1348-20121228/1016_1 /ASSEMBLY_ACC=CAM_ASM_000700 /TAXON_ID=215587 /ORGANISM="Aplanochytrium stocchinoi, Strain GSBS06" /LENGTH=168 /DNA_ID=CAMNT_0052009965 /DNA_START=37 /DNA_END=543 /DNA_ORIENTATION=-
MRRNKSPTVIHAGKNPTIIRPGNKSGSSNNTVGKRVGTVYVRDEANDNLSVDIIIDKNGSVKFDHPACNMNGLHRAKVDHNPESTSPSINNQFEDEKRFSEVLGSDYETKKVEILGESDYVDFSGLKIKEDCDVFVTLIFLKKEAFKDRADITELGKGSAFNLNFVTL